jgi:hypothetical protein
LFNTPFQPRLERQREEEERLTRERGDAYAGGGYAAGGAAGGYGNGYDRDGGGGYDGGYGAVQQQQQQQQQQPVIKIMKREAPEPAKEQYAPKSSATRVQNEQKSVKQRERDYAEVCLPPFVCTRGSIVRFVSRCRSLLSQPVLALTPPHILHHLVLGPGEDHG